MNSPQKVKVIYASYDENSDTIAWTVKLASGQDADLVWLRQDFGPTFGINGLVPVKIVEDFCKSIEGKEITLVTDSAPQKQLNTFQEIKKQYTSEAELIKEVKKH